MNTYKPNWNRRTYSEEEFIEAWNSSRSIAHCARQLNLTIYGATYTTLKKTAESLSLSSDHMSGQGWNRPDHPNYIVLSDHSSSPHLSDDELFVSNSPSNRSTIKKRILKNNLLPLRCAAPHCPNPTTTVDGFTGEEIPTPLILDHINGVNDDNMLENLRFLCPNCDRVNPTFSRGSGSRKTTLSYSHRIGLYTCPECQGTKTKNATVCKDCRHSYLRSKQSSQGFISSSKNLCKCGEIKEIKSKTCQACDYDSRPGKMKPEQEKISWPSDEELLDMLAQSNYTQVGKQLGVSDNAIRGRLKRRGVLPV